jgi:hypothetical protein
VTGVPDFTVDGDPASIRARAAETRATGRAFVDVADALARITTDGWTGRAADAFREAAGAEPGRWRDAGSGFLSAASAYEAYADAVGHARSRAAWAADEYGRGEEVTRAARAAWEHEQSVREAQQLGAATWGTTAPVLVRPFVDPGESIRRAALAAYERAVADLDAAAHTCAGAVRAACAGAPAGRNWFESGLAFLGGILDGAGEAVWDLLTITPWSAGSMVRDVVKLSNGELTPEELAAQYELALEVPGQMLEALRADPVAFGIALGKGLVDWDTWADDPARAIGHLVPDAIAAVATAGVGAVATRGARAGVDLLDTAGDLGTGAHRLDDLGEVGFTSDRQSGLDHAGSSESSALRILTSDDTSGPGWERRLDGPDDPDYGRPRQDAGSTLPAWAEPPAQASPEVRALGGDADHPWGNDPATGAPLTKDEWVVRYIDGNGDLRWPPNDGAVAGTKVEFTDPSAYVGTFGDELDRVGAPTGTYLGVPPGTSWPERALPPDTLGKDVPRYTFDPGAARQNGVTIETSQVAPAFGQPGGGLQVLLKQEGEALSVRRLIELGVLR